MLFFELSGDHLDLPLLTPSFPTRLSSYLATPPSTTVVGSFFQTPDQRRGVLPFAAQRNGVGIELIDQRSDRKACAIRFRFFQRQAKILPHPFDSKAEIELAVRHGERAVVHLPADRKSTRLNSSH